jgi:dTDP-4-dehydrorhamnose 3,5-epimerase
VKIVKTKIPDVLIIWPKRFDDNRGFFSESWNKKALERIGITHKFVQDNHSFSHRAGTLRGLHFQYPPAAQAKLVRCGRGAFLDVVVDIRRGSPTYGEWVSEVLSFENGAQLFVPEGFLHGFVTQVDETEIIYKCSNYYTPDLEGFVAYNDPHININWGPAYKDILLSNKDSASIMLKDIQNPFCYES